MKIISMNIKGLFGTFDYRIEFPKAESELFIITGFNGYGKTTILNMINSLAQKDLFYFFLIPFDCVTICFDEGYNLKITALKSQSGADEKSDVPVNLSRDVSFELFHKGNSEGNIVLTAKDIAKEAKEKVKGIELQVTSPKILSRLAAPRLDKTVHEFLKKNKEVYVSLMSKHRTSIVLTVLSNLKVEFVEAQRTMKIITETKQNTIHKKYVMTVLDVSGRLKSLLDKAKREYLEKAQKIDNTLVDSLLNRNNFLSKDDYEKRKKDAEKAISELAEFGLVEPVKIRPYNDEQKTVLTVYLEKLEEKLKVYDPLREKLLLFKKMIDNLRFVGKKMSFSTVDGILAESECGELIDLDMLSSGEQNEIIMLYSAIFEVADNSILLVDEPETSLHVEWQADFLDNLEQIAKVKSLQVIVSTHSPQIIGSRWGQCYDLCEAVSESSNQTTGTDITQ